MASRRAFPVPSAGIQAGSPKFLMVVSARAVSFDPGELEGCSWSSLPLQCWLHHFRQAGHSRFRVTRLNRVRGRYGSHLALPSLGASGCPVTPWTQLHDSRPIIMINSLHLTTTTKLCLALSGILEIRSQFARCPKDSSTADFQFARAYDRV